MEWNIGIQIFKISVMSDNMNWLDNNLILHRNIEYLQISFHSGKYISIPAELNFKTSFPTTQNIIEYWQSLHSKLSAINGLKELNGIKELKQLKSYKLGSDYYLAPIYIMRSRIILGVFIPDSHSGKILFTKLADKSPETIYGFMSNISNTTKPNSNTYNIISGILEYIPFPENKYLMIQDKNKNMDTDKNKNMDKDNKYKISWKSIIANIRNYLPKIKITYLPPKTSSIDFFRNLPNPSH